MTSSFQTAAVSRGPTHVTPAGGGPLLAVMAEAGDKNFSLVNARHAHYIAASIPPSPRAQCMLGEDHSWQLELRALKGIDINITCQHVTRFPTTEWGHRSSEDTSRGRLPHVTFRTYTGACVHDDGSWRETGLRGDNLCPSFLDLWQGHELWAGQGRPGHLEPCTRPQQSGTHAGWRHLSPEAAARASVHSIIALWITTTFILM